MGNGSESVKMARGYDDMRFEGENCEYDILVYSCVNRSGMNFDPFESTFHSERIYR